jgi:hypothetical protein
VPIGTQPRHRWLALAGIFALGLVIYWPALRSEFLLDDYLHASMIDEHYPVARGPFNLYDFVAEGDRARMLERGMLPWWADHDLEIRFLRPLPSALRWAEQRLFGRSRFVPHVHSFFWWIAAVVAARRLYRRMVAPRPAWLATAIFALAPCHAVPLAWLANREALISLTLGALALDFYLRWRDERRGAYAVGAAALFAASMTAGEYSLCLGGYALALALLAPGKSLDGPGAPKDGWVRRFAGLLSFGVPAAVYLVVRAWLGYGSRGSALYIDPIHETLTFLGVAPRRFARLELMGWFTLDSCDPTVSTLIILVVATIAILAVPLRRTIASADPETRGYALAMLTGSQLSLVPLLAVEPGPRVLGMAVLGLAPVVALILDRAWFPPSPLARRGVDELVGLAALGLGFFQLVHGPGTAWLVGAYCRRNTRDFAAGVADLRDRLGDRQGKEIVVLHARSENSFFMPFALDPEGRPPARWRILATTGHVLALRHGARNLELVVSKGQSLFSWDLFRQSSTSPAGGEVFDTPGLRAKVLEVGPLGPRRVEFEFDRDLDAPDLVWIVESLQGTYPTITLPQPGFGMSFD